MNDDTINPSTMTEAEFVLRERAKRRECWTDLARQAVEDLERKFGIEVVSIEHHEARTKSLQSSLLDFVEKSKARHDAQAAQVALLREALDTLYDAYTQLGEETEDGPIRECHCKTARAALAATPESAGAELAETRKDRAKYAEEVQQLAEILNGGARTAAPFRVVREWAQEATKDKALVDALERRGVRSIYFHNGDQINPASQTLRAAMQQEAKP